MSRSAYSSPPPFEAGAGGYGFDDENPFESGARSVQMSAASTASKAKSKATAKAQQYEQSAERLIQQGTDASELALREANIKAREAKLLEKERQIDERERQVKASEGAKNNWPSRCFPITYHSIEDQIPLDHRSLIKKFYILVIFTWVCLIWNLVTLGTVYGESGDGGSDIIYAAFYIALGVPLSWIGWYKKVYDAARMGGTMNWIIFFIMFFLHIAFSVLMAIGAPNMAGGGLLVMLKSFANGYNVSGIFTLIDLSIWGLNVLITLYLYKRAHTIWKSKGGDKDLALKAKVAKAAVQNAV